MLVKCAECQSRILGGGVTFLDWRFCNEACASRFQAKLVDQVVPAEVVDEQIRRAFEGPCPSCGKPSTNDVYSATKISAFLVVFRINTQRSLCCASCARKNRLKAALHCFFAGRWGPKAAICNLFVFPSDLIAIPFTRARSEPSDAVVTLVKSLMARTLDPQLAAAAQANAVGPAGAAATE